MYPIVNLEIQQEEYPEQLGTKEKFWTLVDGKLSLVKFGREETGEDWSEKIACELCTLLGIAHAHYELAEVNERKCTISSSVVEENERLILGNEVLGKLLQEYHGSRNYHQKEHTVSRVFAVLKLLKQAQFEVAPELGFSGYLLLDALIGNTDRHHENWGLIMGVDRKIRLAPTFDHASSLGRELSDEVKLERLNTNDKRRNIQAYCLKARSAFYQNSNDQKPLSPIDAFDLISKISPASHEHWIKKIENITENDIRKIVSDIPGEFMSDISKEFTVQSILCNRASLLQIEIETEKK